MEDYETIKPIIDGLEIKKTGKVLNIGCGNSELSEKMYDDGYVNNYSIDICENVIEDMKLRNKNRKGIIFETMDVMNMSYPDEYFDLIIDKSTIDALLCGDHSFINTAKMTKEVSRVLKTGGIYCIISYGTPENRVFHLERDHLGFDVKIFTIKREESDEEEKLHYAYISTKKEEANENMNNFDLVIKNLEREELEEDEEEEDEEK